MSFFLSFFHQFFTFIFIIFTTGNSAFKTTFDDDDFPTTFPTMPLRWPRRPSIPLLSALEEEEDDEKDQQQQEAAKALSFSKRRKQKWARGDAMFDADDDAPTTAGRRRHQHHHRGMVFVSEGRRGLQDGDDEDDEDDDATTTEDALEVLANGVTPLVFATHKGGKDASSSDWMNAFGGHNKGVSSNASTTDETNTNDVTEEKEEYVQKREFDLAMLAAQNALKAKTAANRRVHVQAKAAMHNAVTALKLTEKECQRLREELADARRDPDGVTKALIEDARREDRERLRVAKDRVKKLSNAYRLLQSEIAKEKYEEANAAVFRNNASSGGEKRREETRRDNNNNNDDDDNETAFREQTQGASSVSILPVAMEYPIKLDKAHETKSVVLAQLCMQGYALDDCERAMEELQSTDLYECLDWLEEREALRAVYNEDTLMIRKNEVEEEDEKEEEFEEDRAARLRRELAASRLIDDETKDDDEEEDDAAAAADDDDDERSSFELGDEFDYAKYDSSNLRLTPEELYVARSRAVRVLCACATDPPSRQEIDEKDERRMMIKIENDDVDFKDEADDASLESTGMDEEDSDDDDGEDDTSEDLSAKRRAKEAKMNTRANQILNSPIRKGTSSALKNSNKPPFSMMSELGTKKDPEVLRKEYYIRRYKMAFSFRAIVALTKLAESTSSLFFILHNGGVRAATECLRKYGETSSSCARASFALIRQFASGGGGGRGGGGEGNDADDFFSSITAKHFVQTERFHILPLLVLRAIEARMEDFDVVSDGMKCLWTLIALGGDRTRKQLLKSNIAFTIRDALAVSTVVDEQYRGRRFKRIIGCGLTMCLDCTEAQELFTRLSIPGLIRAKLIEFPSIKFSGEFADLREFLANAKKKTQ